MYLVAVAALRAAAFAAAVLAVEAGDTLGSKAIETAAFSLSLAFGDDMVLQRDATSPPASVWGFAEPGTVVTTTFRGADLNSTADVTGAWVQALPSTPAGGPYEIAFAASTGESARLERVMVGDVFLCSGQSNVCFTTDSATNASDEVARAALYPQIRLYTVGASVTSDTPLRQVPAVAQPWSSASPASVGGGNWTYHSALCWLAGRNVADALGPDVPIGLVVSAWGGTLIQAWVDGPTNAACKTDAAAAQAVAEAPPSPDLSPPAQPGQPGPNNDTVLFNSMISPLLPMALRGAWWWQGEQNWQTAPDTYACLFQRLISLWRASFASPDLYFGFVLLAPPYAPSLRDAQFSAAALPRVGYATAEDIGDNLSPWQPWHPRSKQLPAARIAASALAIAYGMPVAWEMPQAAGTAAAHGGGEINVTVTFAHLSGGQIEIDPSAASASCPLADGVALSACGFPTVFGSDGVAYNATLSLGPGDTAVVFSARAPDGVAPAGVAYGDNSWPVLSIFSTEEVRTRWETVRLPALHFKIML